MGWRVTEGKSSTVLSPRDARILGCLTWCIPSIVCPQREQEHRSTGNNWLQGMVDLMTSKNCHRE